MAFNEDISHWDTSSVTNMFNLFALALSFNQDIGGWDVSNVVDMDGMFVRAESFNQDLSGWCVDNIPALPLPFAQGTLLWTLPQPVWGTCP